MPPRLCPTIRTRRPRRCATASIRASSWAAACERAADVGMDVRPVGAVPLRAQRTRPAGPGWRRRPGTRAPGPPGRRRDARRGRRRPRGGRRARRPSATGPQPSGLGDHARLTQHRRRDAARRTLRAGGSRRRRRWPRDRRYDDPRATRLPKRCTCRRVAPGDAVDWSHGQPSPSTPRRRPSGGTTARRVLSAELFAPVSPGIELCYQTFGDPADEPLLLVMGLGEADDVVGPGALRDAGPPRLLRDPLRQPRRRPLHPDRGPGRPRRMLVRGLRRPPAAAAVHPGRHGATTRSACSTTSASRPPTSSGCRWAG